MVDIATMQLVLDLYGTFPAKLEGNSFVTSAKNYPQPACFGKVMPKIAGARFFETQCRSLMDCE